MIDTRITLSIVWVAVMLVYLLGDVLRIFAGGYVSGEIEGVKVTQMMWLGIAVLMVLPIVMGVLSILLPFELNRWANIIMAGFFFLFNLVGLPTYPMAFDQFLLVVSMVFNVVTVWTAWQWVAV